MRPINLIPTEQRRGASRGAGARPSFNGYIVLGALGAAVVCALAVVMTSNQINSKTEELAEIQGDSQKEKQVADALRPYGQFADLQRARMTQIKTRCREPLRLGAPAAPALEGDSAQRLAADRGGHAVAGRRGWTRGAGGDVSSMREKHQAPAFAISGCTYSQHAVARMMTRMRNLDDVTAVHLAKSVRKDSSDAVRRDCRHGGPAAGAAGGGHPGLHRLGARDQVRHPGRVRRSDRLRRRRPQRRRALGLRGADRRRERCRRTGRRSFRGSGRYDPVTRRDTYIVTVDRRARRGRRLLVPGSVAEAREALRGRQGRRRGAAGRWTRQSRRRSSSLRTRSPSRACTPAWVVWARPCLPTRTSPRCWCS